eukprot:PhF_6_TR14923/c0_g1_i1/m.23333
MPPVAAPKKAPPPPPPVEEVPLVDPVAIQATISRNIKKHILSSAEAHDVARSMIEIVYEKAEAVMIENYLEKTAVPLTIHEISVQLIDVMHLVFIDRDRDEIEPFSLGEPLMVPTDPHSRGAVPTRTALKLNPQQQQTPLTTKDLSATGGKPRIARNTPATEARPQTRGTESTAGGEEIASTSVLQGSASGTKSRVDKDKKDTDKDKDDPLKQSQLQQDADGPTLENDDDEVLRLHLEAVKRRQMDIVHGSERLRNVLSTLNVKEFTIDGDEVIPVVPCDPQKLPLRKIDIRTTVPSGGEKTVPLDDKTQTTDKQNKKPNGKPSKSAKPPWNLFTSLEVTAPPMVLGVAPSPGVVSKEGDATKKSDFKNPRLSRAEFRKQLEAQSMNAQNAGTMHPDDLEEIMEDLTASKAEIPIQGRQRSNSHSSQPEAQKAPTPAQSNGNLKGADRVKELAKQNIAKVPANLHKHPKKEIPHVARDRLHKIIADGNAHGASPDGNSPQHRKCLPPPLYPSTVGHGMSPIPSARESVASSTSRFALAHNDQPSKVVVSLDLLDDISKDFVTKYTNQD